MLEVKPGLISSNLHSYGVLIISEAGATVPVVHAQAEGHLHGHQERWPGQDNTAIFTECH